MRNIIHYPAHIVPIILLCFLHSFQYTCLFSFILFPFLSSIPHPLHSHPHSVSPTLQLLLYDMLGSGGLRRFERVGGLDLCPFSLPPFPHQRFNQAHERGLPGGKPYSCVFRYTHTLLPFHFLSHLFALLQLAQTDALAFTSHTTNIH